MSGGLAGKIEIGESAKDAIKREVEEETGIKIVDSHVVSLGSHVFNKRSQGEYSIDLYLYNEYSDRNITINAEEYSEYGWFSDNELAEYDIIPDTTHLIKKARIRII